MVNKRHLITPQQLSVYNLPYVACLPPSEHVHNDTGRCPTDELVSLLRRSMPFQLRFVLPVGFLFFRVLLIGPPILACKTHALELLIKQTNNLTNERRPKPARCRQAMIQKFNTDSASRVFMISTNAGNMGINLVAANRVILLDTSWNPAHDLQAMFR